MRHVLLYTPQMRRHSGGGGGSRGAHEERQQTRAQQDQQGQQGAKRSHPGHDDGGLWDAVRRDAGWALAVRRERTRSQWAEWLSRGDGRVLEWPVLGMGVEMLHCRSWHHITWRCPVSSCGVLCWKWPWREPAAECLQSTSQSDSLSNIHSHCARVRCPTRHSFHRGRRGFCPSSSTGEPSPSPHPQWIVGERRLRWQSLMITHPPTRNSVRSVSANVQHSSTLACKDHLTLPSHHTFANTIHASVAIAIQRGNALAIQAGYSRAVMRASRG